MRTVRTAVLALVILGAMAASPPAGAEWESDLAVYLWGSGLDGRVGVGQNVGEVDLSFSDILDDLDFGFMGGYSGSNGKWALQADVVIANLSSTEEGELGIVQVDLDNDLTVVEADLGYETSDTSRVFVGARYVDLSSEVAIRVGNQSPRFKSSESWVDPVVGFRLGTARDRGWNFWFRGDVGGFGVGSDFSWNAVAAAAYRFSDRVGVAAGYRVLDIDYEDGKGQERFLYDTQMSGFVAGMIFSF